MTVVLDEDDDENGEDLTSAKQFAARMPLPLATGGAQQLPNRTRKCGFWISPFVADGMVLIVDTANLVNDAAWTHNPARDKIPANALLVVINSRHEQHIRKAMATWDVVPGPSWVAAGIIDDCCRKDPSMASRLRWEME